MESKKVNSRQIQGSDTLNSSCIGSNITSNSKTTKPHLFASDNSSFNSSTPPNATSNLLQAEELPSKNNINSNTNISNGNVTMNHTSDQRRLSQIKQNRNAGNGSANAANSLMKSVASRDRFSSEKVRKNWKTVLDVALIKRSELVDNEANFNSSLSNHRSFILEENREIYATNKENWIYFSIILAIVLALSVLFCFMVYWFFPQFRAKHMF